VNPSRPTGKPGIHALRAARPREALFLVLASGLLPSCAATTPPSAPASSFPAAPDSAAEFPEDAAILPRYHSKRLELSLPLPRGAEWRIDDHSLAVLVATHAPTHSRVVVAILRADTNVGRGACETMAEERRLVPAGALQPLDDEVTVTQQTFDTRVEVALIVGDSANRPIVGHVIAFGGFLRKCYVFDFSTEVPNAAGEGALATRLAFARARILGGLELDSMNPSTHSAPVGPDAARAP
jgi:hypothetical protein